MMNWKKDGCGCDLIKELSQHLPEEKHGKSVRKVSQMRSEMSTF
jgi:hypothetical protein